MKDTYRFEDPSGLAILVHHVMVPLNTFELPYPRTTPLEKIIHQQPSSEIRVEVPAGAPVNIAEAYEAITRKKPPTGFTPENGNQFLIGTVTGMISQVRISEALLKSRLFEEDTVVAVHECCNNSTPNVSAAR